MSKFVPVVLLLLLTACGSDPGRRSDGARSEQNSEKFKALEKAINEEASRQVPEPSERIRSLPLDLTIPDQELDTEAPEQGQSTTLLPDLFSQQAGPDASSTSRTSVGGRLVLDEDNPDYSMEAVRGAEVTLEVLTP